MQMDTPSRMARAKEQGFDVDNPVYHGSHDFGENIDLGQYGSGEGGEGYGYGFHVSKSKNTADNYSESLKSFTVDGDKVYANDNRFNILQMLNDNGLDDSRKILKEVIDQNPDLPFPKERLILLEDLANKSITYQEIPKKTYELYIPKNDRFIDFSKPLIKQSKFVRGVLDNHPDMKFDDNMSGESIYYDLAKELGGEFGGDLAASNSLNSLGIKGIKYIDDIAAGYYGNTTKKQKIKGGNFNYSLFDQSNIRSPDAAFDPAKTGSSNLLASNPVATTSAGILGLAAMSSSDDADAGVVGKSLASITKDAEKQGVKLDVFESKKGLELSKIVVPEKSKGVGTSIMNDLVGYADQTGQTVSLSPSTDFGGTSKKRLSEFYKRFGFVQNKGKNKDFTISNSMYRSPSSVVKAVAPVGTGLLGLGSAAQSNDTYADYSPSNLARLQSSDVGSIEAPQSMAASNIAGLMGSVNKVGYDDPLLGMVASQLPSELINKIAYNDKRGLLDYAKAYAGLLGF